VVDPLALVRSLGTMVLRDNFLSGRTACKSLEGPEENVVRRNCSRICFAPLCCRPCFEGIYAVTCTWSFWGYLLRTALKADHQNVSGPPKGSLVPECQTWLVATKNISDQ
jgi:hypothetical protein